MIISCAILVCNNIHEFSLTMASVVSQSKPESSTLACCETVIIDSSHEPFSYADIVISVELPAWIKVRVLRQYPAEGIYAAMNLALNSFSGDMLIFMNSGDCFHDSDALASMSNAATQYRASHGSYPIAVFGQSQIIPADGACPQWLVPDPRISNINLWLRWFTPNHQSVMVEASWARSHHFDESSGLCADRVWMREALVDPTQYIYLPFPVARYRLGGVSSRLPSWSQMIKRVLEPTRKPWERLAEIAKFMLKPAESFYPWIMRLKSTLLGFLL